MPISQILDNLKTYGNIPTGDVLVNNIIHVFSVMMLNMDKRHGSLGWISLLTSAIKCLFLVSHERKIPVIVMLHLN